MVEAIIPLNRGTMQHSFGDMNVNIHGLEKAGAGDVNIIAREIARTMSRQLQERRRGS